MTFVINCDKVLNKGDLIMSEKMITINQAAIILNVHPNTIRNYIDRGCLKPFSLPSGKKILLYEDDVKNLIQEKIQERLPNE